MSIPGMEGHSFGTYHCNVCGVRLTYGKMCLDCKRAKKGKPAYTSQQRNNADVWDGVKGLVYLFVVFPVVVMLLFLVASALGN
jgi:hypothetical protein